MIRRFTYKRPDLIVHPTGDLIDFEAYHIKDLAIEEIWDVFKDMLDEDIENGVVYTINTEQARRIQKALRDA